jgi:hypothetical protein
MRRLLLLSSLLLAACGNGGAFKLTPEDLPMSPITEAKAKLVFSCVHETIPAPSAEADVLFQYARWLQKNNQLKEDATVDIEIERLYRIAAENGHYKANINLQNGTMRGHFKLRADEHLRLSQNLIDAGVATGYYFISIFLKNGSAGLRRDEDMSLRYLRKAADQGSAEAQYYVGEKLEPSNIAPKIAFQMYRCAAEQGHGEAALTLGVYLKDEQHQEALEAYQLGIAAGNSTSASFLTKGFRNPPPSNTLHYLGQQKDLERADRYEKIWRILANYSYANPTVPEINEIVPLPPAPLPAWDGKLQWLEARLANIPPEKPSEALIKQLAKAMVLDPATGKPMPGSPGFSQAHLSAPYTYSGQACPQTGYWTVVLYSWEYSLDQQNVVRHFNQGDILPTHCISRSLSRIWPLPKKVTQGEQHVTWRLA